ncbi:protein FAR-RED IMPAIRED RESPONSE 1-like [Hevea brasiliensis]|uniref:protein FAR-RED IMPAIRED RESPONSE 1-like n=1 Tax=Hevea brasiliensis TaxID=3981 RepID=UPI0025EEAD1F|nr:protein FAR-RED IMPAIRED RESPONSE 1-like [Hevea brasiliensis]
MVNIHPHVILTDQCESIKVAIREVMPKIRHRFYLWPILSKMSENFKGVEGFTKATNEFKALIFDSLTIETFETNWNDFLTKYGLENNEWLMKLYSERENWVPVYLKHMFWVGMMSTQRSEGMHANFDGYVNSRSTLKQFIEQYEMAIRGKNEKELLSEFIKCLWYCDVNPSNEDEESNEHGMERYNILERCIINDWYRKEFVYRVEHRENEQYFNCNCKKFDSSGILCCYILKVIVTKGMEVINERYLFRRWRKDVHHPYIKRFFARGYPMMTDEYKKHHELEGDFAQITDIVIGNTQKMEYVKRQLRALQVNLSEWNDGLLASAVGSENIGITNSDSLVAILNPNEACSYERPRSNRF